MGGWRTSNADHHHGDETTASTATTMCAAPIRGRPPSEITEERRSFRSFYDAVCAALPLFAQCYARYKNALPNADGDVHGGADERSTEYQNHRVHRQGVGNSGGPIRI